MEFPAAFLSISHDGAIIFVFGEKGLIQAYDLSLQHIMLYSVLEESPTHKYLDLGKYFKSSVYVQGGVWVKPNKTINAESRELSLAFNSIFVKLKKGPIITIRISMGMMSSLPLGILQLTNEYLRKKMFVEALIFVGQLSWLHSGKDYKFKLICPLD